MLIEFPYRTKDGVLETKDCIAILDTEFIHILGQLTKIVYNPVKIGPVKMTGLYLRHKGVEYGSLSISLSQFNAELSACNCPANAFKLFDFEFDFEFE